MPQSMTPMRPSRSSIMFPACTSPWNAPQRTVVRKKARMTSWTNGVGSKPRSATRARSSIGHAVEELHGQHVAPRQVEIRLGHRHEPEVELVLQPPEVHQRAGLVAQVHLLADLHPEAVEQLQGRARHLVARLAHQDLEQGLHEVEVGGHDVLDLGPQHLDRHDPPVEQAGPVDHGDRRRPDRLGLERREGVAERHPEVLLHPLAHVGERHRWSRVETGPELVGHVVAEHARATTR